ncbi:PREDICTED: olfactory receptor 1D5-like [Cercocebus atys]|uniref:olfactory receptor 1D5-like n=1 Tax=Cercocebus atys TaxID=9531 RepID=UPI0005F36261|nr:PREDICTED: olfactory receptor 1D5-like [Cercocebus atys]
MRALNKHLLVLMLQKVGGMDGDNQSENSQFLLLGMSESPEQQQILFWMFLSMYLVTVVGNVLIILAISSDSRLHTPMYFFLASLSFTDLFFVTNTIPKMLVNLQSQNKAISYAGCLTQLYFLVSLVTLDNLILAVMAYDRYVAICHPLHYTTAMSPGLCVLLLCLCWGLSVLYGLLLTLLLTRVTFCGSRKIHYLFCEMYVLLRLACSNIHVNHTVLVATGCFIFLTPLGFTTTSYVRIVRTILQIPSASKKYKTFSTCASMFIVSSLDFLVQQPEPVYVSISEQQNSDPNMEQETLLEPLLPGCQCGPANCPLPPASWRKPL